MSPRFLLSTFSPPSSSGSSRFAAFLLAVALGGVACGAPVETEPTESEPAAESTETPGRSATVAEYFPLQVGSRWRYRNGDESLTRAVISESEGRVAVRGGDIMGTLLYTADESAVAIVSPTGEVSQRVLVAPIELGAAWQDQNGDVRCMARYESVDTHVELAGLSVGSCIEVARECVHPAGKPFAEETRERHREVYCPHIGRVRESMSLSPAPGGDMPSSREDALVFYRVAGAPAPAVPTPFSCDAFLLVQEDVQAACGAAFRLAPDAENSADGATGCELTFESTAPGASENDATGSATGETGEDTSTRSLRFSAFPTSEMGAPTATEPLLQVEENGYVARLEGSADACPPARVALLGPLLRSLLAR